MINAIFRNIKIEAESLHFGNILFVRCIDSNTWLNYLGYLLSMSCQSCISYPFLPSFKNVYGSVLLVYEGIYIQVTEPKH